MISHLKSKPNSRPSLPTHSKSLKMLSYREELLLMKSKKSSEVKISKPRSISKSSFPRAIKSLSKSNSSTKKSNNSNKNNSKWRKKSDKVMMPQLLRNKSNLPMTKELQITRWLKKWRLLTQTTMQTTDLIIKFSPNYF